MPHGLNKPVSNDKPASHAISFVPEKGSVPSPTSRVSAVYVPDPILRMSHSASENPAESSMVSRSSTPQTPKHDGRNRVWSTAKSLSDDPILVAYFKKLSAGMATRVIKDAHTLINEYRQAGPHDRMSLVNSLAKSFHRWSAHAEQSANMLHSSYFSDDTRPKVSKALTLDFEKLLSLAGGGSDYHNPQKLAGEMCELAKIFADAYLDLAAAYLAPEQQGAGKDECRNVFVACVIKCILKEMSPIEWAQIEKQWEFGASCNLNELRARLENMLAPAGDANPVPPAQVNPLMPRPTATATATKPPADRPTPAEPTPSFFARCLPFLARKQATRIKTTSFGPKKTS